MDELLQFLFALRKFKPKIAVARSFSKIWRYSFFANIPNLIVGKYSEIRIGCYTESGGDFCQTQSARSKLGVDFTFT